MTEDFRVRVVPDCFELLDVSFGVFKVRTLNEFSENELTDV
jgi:hypothetical protein